MTVVERHADVISIRMDAAAGEGPSVASMEAVPLAAAAGEQRWRWRDSPRLELATPLIGTLAIVRDRHGPLDLDALPEMLSVQPRRGGEALRPAPGARTRKLKALLQEAKVPPAQRESLPLLYANDKLIAVADRWLDASVQASARTKRRARLRFAYRDARP
jgi:tRNA(Ile)-lysidine synthase